MYLSFDLINTGWNRNTFHILKCHVCGARELKQVVMVAPSSKFLIIFVRYDHDLNWCILSLCCQNVFNTGQSGIATRKTLHANLFFVGMFLIEFSSHSSIYFLSRRASFWRNMKWAWKVLWVAITDSPVLKMFPCQMRGVHWSKLWL